MNTLLIAKRDLQAYLTGYTAWVVVSGLLFLEGMFFNAYAMGSDSQRYSHEVLRDFFEVNWGFAVVASVLLTMRSIAEERRDGTDVLLSGSTATDGQVIVGKWLAVMGVLSLLTAFSIYLPGLIYVNGKISLAHLAVGYLGVMATVGATTAMGIFGSSLFRNQMAAGMVTGSMVVLLIIAWIASDIMGPPFSEMIAYSALYNQHFVNFSEGRLAMSGLVYYASLTGLFLMLATRILEGRRWE